jgi:hypothetical protein
MSYDSHASGTLYVRDHADFRPATPEELIAAARDERAQTQEVELERASTATGSIAARGDAKQGEVFSRAL